MEQGKKLLWVWVLNHLIYGRSCTALVMQLQLSPVSTMGALHGLSLTQILCCLKAAAQKNISIGNVCGGLLVTFGF